MKTRLVAVLVLLALMLFPVLSIVLPADVDAATKEAAADADLLDINTVTVEQLKALPGIGDAYSEKIIKHRPYKRKDELVQRKIIPQATYDKIKDQIVARQK